MFCRRRGFSLRTSVLLPVSLWGAPSSEFSRWRNFLNWPLIHNMWGIPLSLWICLLRISHGASRAILINLFCIIWSFFIFVRDTASHTGHANVIGCLFNDVKIWIKHLIYWVELWLIEGLKILNTTKPFKRSWPCIIYQEP